MNTFYIKFLIELSNLLKRYRAELYKSGIDGKQKVEFGEYSKYSDNTTNVFTLSDKNIITYDIVNEKSKDHILYDKLSKEYISDVKYIVRTKSGNLKVYNKEPKKILGFWVGNKTNITIDKLYYPELKYTDKPLQVLMNLTTII